MDWSLHTKCCTLAIATVTLGLSVIYLTRKTQEESIVQPEPEVEQKSEVQPELEIANAQLEPEAEQKSEAQSESGNLYDSENQLISEVHLEPEAQPELKNPNAQLKLEVEMAGAVAQPIEALNIVASMEQMKLVEHQPDAAAPEEVELPDRDSANHSPSDFLS